jgi:hypothetical protein
LAKLPYEEFKAKELLVKGQLINASNNEGTAAHCSNTCPKCGVRKCELSEDHTGNHQCSEGHTW